MGWLARGSRSAIRRPTLASRPATRCNVTAAPKAKCGSKERRRGASRSSREGVLVRDRAQCVRERIPRNARPELARHDVRRAEVNTEQDARLDDFFGGVRDATVEPRVRADRHRGSEGCLVDGEWHEVTLEKELQ